MTSMMMAVMTVRFFRMRAGADGNLAPYASQNPYPIKQTPPTTNMAISEGFL